MKLKRILSASLVLGAATIGNVLADTTPRLIGGVTLITPPAAVNAPNPETNRVVWCLGQNIDNKRSFTPVSTAILGDNGTVVSEISGDIGPGKTVWLAGASGGSGTIYCRFNVKSRQSIRGYLVVQDEPKTPVPPPGSPSYKHTVLSLEAR